MDHLSQHIEALVFASDQPVTFTEIKSVLEATFEQSFTKPDLSAALKAIAEKYQAEVHAFDFIKIGGGYQFLTKPSYHNTIGTYLKQTAKKRLSSSALETLAITAYKQPVTKAEVEKIRGVNCDYAMEKLLEKDLVEILGRRHAPGRPLEYGTSQKFMDYFGLESLEELPKLKEFANPDNSVGEAAPIEEDVPVAAMKHLSPEAQIIYDAVQMAIGISTIIDGPKAETSEEAGETPAEYAPPSAENLFSKDAIKVAITVSDILGGPGSN